MASLVASKLRIVRNDQSSPSTERIVLMERQRNLERRISDVTDSIDHDETFVPAETLIGVAAAGKAEPVQHSEISQ